MTKESQEKIINPVTGRFVLKNGRIGRRLLNSKSPVRKSPSYKSPSYKSPSYSGKSCQKCVFDRSTKRCRKRRPSGRPRKDSKSPKNRNTRRKKSTEKTVKKALVKSNASTRILSSTSKEKDLPEKCEMISELTGILLDDRFFYKLLRVEHKGKEYLLFSRDNDKYFYSQFAAFKELQKTGVVPKIITAWTCKGEGYIMMENLKRIEECNEDPTDLFNKVNKVAKKIEDYGWLLGEISKPQVMCDSKGNVYIVGMDSPIKRTALGDDQPYPQISVSLGEEQSKKVYTWKMLKALQDVFINEEFNPYSIATNKGVEVEYTEKQKQMYLNAVEKASQIISG